MTLTSEINRAQYSGDGAQIAFPITFVFWLDADIRAIHTDANGSETIWAFGTHYTLTGGDGGTGTLTAKTTPTDYTPASGETLTITSNLEDTQDTSLPEGGAFPSSSVEQQLDKIVRLIQQKAEQLGRALKLPVSSANTDLEIPDPSASQFLRWNAGATALENADISGAGSIGIPVTVAEGGTNSTTAAAARTALGLAIGTDVLGNLVEDTTPQLGGALDANGQQIREGKGADVASATVLTLGIQGNYFDVTGTTTITSIGTLAVGTRVTLHFDAALTLTHDGSNIILPGGASITTAAGDEATFIEYATGQWRCTSYTKASGLPIVGLLPSPDFTSSEQTVTLDTVLNVAHGLGAIPTLVQVTLRNKTTEHGYVAGDEIIYASTAGANTDSGVDCSFDATNVTLVQGANNYVKQQSSLNGSSITVGNWKWVIRAWS